MSNATHAPRIYDYDGEVLFYTNEEMQHGIGRDFPKRHVVAFFEVSDNWLEEIQAVVKTCNAFEPMRKALENLADYVESINAGNRKDSWPLELKESRSTLKLARGER